MKGAIFSLVLLVLALSGLGFVLYAYTPGELQELSVEILKPALPESNASSTLKQFTPNMRFSHNRISYYYKTDCSEAKRETMKEAFDILASEVSEISFYETVKSDADISISCSETDLETKKSTFVAGEGGPSEFLNFTPYSLIVKGEILLYKSLSENCDYPVVQLHELLHVLGYEHINKKQSILYEYFDCKQRIDNDIITHLESLYSVEPKSELSFSELSAEKSGIYLDFEASVTNTGLISSEKTEIEVSSGNKKENFELGLIEPGISKTITIKNFRLASRSSTQVSFKILTPTPEYDIQDNIANAEI